MTSLNNKLRALKELYSRYEALCDEAKKATVEADIVYDLYLSKAQEIARLMQKRNLSEITTRDGKFSLVREVSAKIIDRARAEAYDEKCQVGIFHKVISGMRLKAWAKELLQLGLEIPDFLVVNEHWNIRIDK
ncbi:MAG: hypothetical protein ABIK73_04005 [candidate division WOR-3 bacterium]